MISFKHNAVNVLALVWMASSILSLCMIFFYAPVDENMGISQKIFYVHLGSASAMALAVTVVFVNSIIYLVKGTEKSDMLAAAAAQTSVMFGSIVLLTGMIWAKAAWGRFFPLGEVKLVMFLILWVIFAAYLVLRGSIESKHKKARAGAVFAIMGFILMPFVVLVTRMFDFGFQLHPNVIKSHDAGMPNAMLATLLVSIASWLAGSIVLTMLTCKIKEIEQMVEMRIQA